MRMRALLLQDHIPSNGHIYAADCSETVALDRVEL